MAFNTKQTRDVKLMYRVDNLSYKIGNKTILEGIDLDLKTNNFLSIVGGNGSGKSTLLKSINRNITEYDGDIYLEEKLVESYSDRELATKRSVLKQSFEFPYSFKGIEIIEMGLYAYDITKKSKDMIMGYIIEKLDIKSLSKKDYTYLSGGEKQKIQLARVMTQIYASKEKNKMFFLDEPTLNLDVFYQYKFLELIKEFIKEIEIGVCAVLHDLNQAYLYSDEIVMIKDKQIKYYGKTNDVLTYENIYDVFGVKTDFVYSEKFEKKILINGI